MVCTNVLVLKSKHSQSCYLLSLFPFTQKFCLSFSKVPLSMVRRDRFHKACYCVSASWDCFVAEISVMFLVCMRPDTRTHMRTGVYVKRYLWKYDIWSGFGMDSQFFDNEDHYGFCEIRIILRNTEGCNKKPWVGQFLKQRQKVQHATNN